ncbi:MAG TPA: hypothetical protein VGD40_18525 [Chryseosolibacter sp.]
MASTRQLRLNDISKIRERITEFGGKQITLVLHDGRTTTGRVEKITAEDISMVNMRNKTMTFRFTDIAELYFDTLD